MRPDGMQDIELEAVVRLFRASGVSRLYVKYLAPNDNSKNQIYLRSSLELINLFPVQGDIRVDKSTSRKPGGEGKSRLNMKASIPFYWLDSAGRSFSAPSTQLILYPQYPEVRMSGFLQGAEWCPSELLRPAKRGREEGRVLFLGIHPSGKVLGFLADPQSSAARNARDLDLESEVGPLAELDIEEILGLEDERTLLLRELRRIHELDWIQSKTLKADGSVGICRGPRCGGYTLEAELGVVPNGLAEPDFHGWEVKQHGVTNLARPANRPITLMTPNPDFGDFYDLSLVDFVRQYGYPDRNGRPHRLNFGGIYRHGDAVELTGLTLRIDGFDPRDPGRFEADGSVRLEDDRGTIAAGWSFPKLLKHWQGKHNRAVYVPSESKRGDLPHYRYGRRVSLGQQTNFLRFLDAIASGALYLDPASKIVEVPGETIRKKSRNQFRMKCSELHSLYRDWETVDLLAEA
jgi:hypothetical protein